MIVTHRLKLKNYCTEERINTTILNLLASLTELIESNGLSDIDNCLHRMLMKLFQLVLNSLLNKCFLFCHSALGPFDGILGRCNLFHELCTLEAVRYLCVLDHQLRLQFVVLTDLLHNYTLLALHQPQLSLGFGACKECSAWRPL